MVDDLDHDVFVMVDVEIEVVICYQEKPNFVDHN